MIYLISMLVLWTTVWATRDRWSRELEIILLSIPEVYILVYAVQNTIGGVTGRTLPIVELTVFSVVVGLLLGARWAPRMIGTDRTTLLSVSVSVLFGVALGTTTAVALHPRPVVIDSLFAFHVQLAETFLDQFQAILGVQVEQISPALAQTIEVFLNNAELALIGGGLGLIGGLVLLGVPAILIVTVNTGVFFGTFAGILIRNTMNARTGIDVVLAPPLGYLSSLGLVVFGHTFWEFVGIMMVAVGAAVAARSVWTDDGISLVYVVGGIGLIAVAAFIEVWVSGPIITLINDRLVVEPGIIATDSRVIGYLSMIVTTAVVAWVLARTIQWTIRQVEATI